MIIIKIITLYFIHIRHTDDVPSTDTRLVGLIRANMTPTEVKYVNWGSISVQILDLDIHHARHSSSYGSVPRNGSRSACNLYSKPDNTIARN